MELCEYSTQKGPINHRLISLEQTYKYYEIDEFISQDLLYIVYKNKIIDNLLPQTILYMALFFGERHLPIYLMYWGDIDDGEITFTLPAFIIYIDVGGMDFMTIYNYPKYVTYLSTSYYTHIKHIKNLLYLDLHIPKYQSLSYLSQYLIELTINGDDDLLNKYPHYLVYLHAFRIPKRRMDNIPKSLLTIISKYKNEYGYI